MSFWGFYIDPLYLLIFVITLAIAVGAQFYMSSTYKKWNNVKNSAGLKGGPVGYRIFKETGLGVDPEAIAAPVETPELKKLANLRDKGIVTPEKFEAKKKQIIDAQGNAVVSRVKLKRTPGQMTDHYDPKTHTVRLSENVVARPSVATMAIVAHELGHAQQHENNSVLITMRNLLVPAVNFSSPLAYLCIFLGLLFNLSGLFGLGILFFALMVLFTFVTLPVEFDASRRGLKLLDESGLMQTESDSQGSKRVLRAEALTYVAAAVTAVLKLLYFISLSRRGRGRRWMPPCFESSASQATVGLI